MEIDPGLKAKKRKHKEVKAAPADDGMIVSLGRSVTEAEDSKVMSSSDKEQN